MASAALADANGPYNLRSDGEPGIDGYLGDFRRGPATFTLYQVAPVPHRYTPGPAEYLIDVFDGAGPRECCRFTDDRDDQPEWTRTWKNDDWCAWIIQQAKRIIANPVID